MSICCVIVVSAGNLNDDSPTLSLLAQTFHPHLSLLKGRRKSWLLQNLAFQFPLLEDRITILRPCLSEHMQLLNVLIVYLERKQAAVPGREGHVGTNPKAYTYTVSEL